MIVEQDERKVKNAMSSLILLSTIIFFGFMLRLYHFNDYLLVYEDSIWYIHTSTLFQNGEWLSLQTTPKAPFFTMLLSLFFSIFGSTFSVSRILPLLFGGLLPIPVYFLGSHFFGRRVGVLAAFIVSISPLLTLYSGLPFREGLFWFMSITAFFFSIRGFKGNIVSSILAGVCLGFSAMTIEAGLFTFIGLLFYYLLETIKNEDVSCKNLDLLCCSCFLTMLPFLLRNYLTYGDAFKQFTRVLGSSITWGYFGLMAVIVPYILFFRGFFSKNRLTLTHRHVRIIKLFLIVTVILLAVMFVGSSLAVYILGLQPNTQNPRLSFNRFPVEFTVGFIKLMESLAAPESLGILLIVVLLVVAYGVKIYDYNIMGLFFLPMFSGIPFAVTLPSHYYQFRNLTFEEVVAHHPVWPFDNAMRYCTNFIPVLAIIASYGIFLSARKLQNILRGRTGNIRQIILVCIITLIISTQFYFADANLRLKANCDHDSLVERYTSIGWLSDRGSPKVYCFNPFLQEIYGHDEVVLLSIESLREIAERAGQEKIKYIIADAFGVYSYAQQSLFFRGYMEDESFMRLSYFNLTMSNKNWPYDQLYSISWVELEKTALIVHHSDLGIQWLSFLSENYFVDIVEDTENLTPYLSIDYNLIVLADIMRPLEDEELDILRERVADGSVLIVNGLSPAYMKIEENNQFFGAKTFIEAPKEEKWNITFRETARKIIPWIDLNKSYALHSDTPWSSPTGCTGTELDVTVYAKRIPDGAAVIFARPYLEGTVIFSGIRHYYASNTEDYSPYIEFIQKMIDKADNNMLFTN